MPCKHFQLPLIVVGKLESGSGARIISIAGPTTSNLGLPPFECNVGHELTVDVDLGSPDADDAGGLSLRLRRWIGEVEDEVGWKWGG